MKAKQKRRNNYKEKYLNGTLNPIEYLNRLTSTIGRANCSPEIYLNGNNSDGSSGDDLTIDEEEICIIFASFQ